MFARVALNLPQINGVFDYHLAEALQGKVLPGCLVIVPLGGQVVQGVVLELSPQSQVQTTRPVEALLDETPVLTQAQLRLAGQMAEQTLAPLAACIELMLPPGLSQHADTAYACHTTPQPTGQSERPLSPVQQRLLKLLAGRGELRGRQFEAALPRQNWKDAIQLLVRRGLVTSRPVLPPPSVRPKYVRTVQLAVSPEEAEARIASVGRGMALPRRQAILRFLQQEPWPVLVDWAYAASGGSLVDLQKLAEDGLVILAETEIWRDPLSKIEVTQQQPPVLTSGQLSVWEELLRGLRANAAGEETQPFLLHGVTGSGKTEIYLRAVSEILGNQRQAIILVPEIALTPQTVRRFMARFPGRVGLVHSRLSAGERYDTWRRARAGQLSVIIGPRSALFTPLPNLGLIVVDECHEDSYYQETQPAYHAVQTAIDYARLNGCTLLLGSATPDVTLVYRARREGWNQLHLPERILAHRQAVEAQMERIGRSLPDMEGQEDALHLPLPVVHVVDMREELKQGRHAIFSQELETALDQVLQHDQQAILYLNRRGTATYVFCRVCGRSLDCPRCEIPLTYHAEASGLICHHCGYQRLLPSKCPQCSSTQIRQFGTGTEKVESELQTRFPRARILRWDWETTRQKGAHDLILTHFANQQADFLVGTQMLAKGLDLPMVTLVGIILADVGLALPDFRAAERVFQLLTQVAGRAGRSPLGGQVVLQTFQPDHYAIQAAARHDFQAFYQREIELRRKIGYPPFAHLLRLETRHALNQSAEQKAQELAAQLTRWIADSSHPTTAMIGPVPCYFSRENGLYRWQIILRGQDPAAVLRGRSLQGWQIQVDPPSLL
jgi:primosomal protein N' (replication factor Y)